MTRRDAALLLPPGAAIALLAGLGGALFGLAGAVAGAVAGALTGGGWSAWRHEKRRRRRALLSAPFPSRWRTILAHRCDTYVRLPGEWRLRFEQGVRLFLSDKRITGVGVSATDELRVLVAASAVTLSVGWDDYAWPQLSEVLLYAQDFDRHYAFDSPDLSGQTHPWGTVILSVPTLIESFARPDDAFHVGFHEFAHLLDVESAHFDGAPAGLGDDAARQWAEVLEAERGRLRKGGVIDPYGERDPVEFFAVAVEAFFECPEDLAHEHPRLHGLLRDFFRQDPAAWDRARLG